ncbi:MAG TPA: OmpA family protein [Anaeromyxobacter sp.]|nr:OmpA family protein [Anaeromyxobacter sp.]
MAHSVTGGKLTRPRKEEDEDITSFWLITYSDMVTLLLSFFLLMYSFSVFSEESRKQLVDELRDVTKNKVQVERPREDLEQAAREIAAQFQKDQTFVENTETEVTVGLSSEVTFASGDDALSDRGRVALVKAGGILARLPNTVRIEGHTDSIPMRGARFSSNWHLSAARAQSVVKLLIANGVDPRRMQVVGFGDVRPRAANETPEGRAQNRRIEIKILRKASEGGDGAATGGGGGSAGGGG